MSIHELTQALDNINTNIIQNNSRQNAISFLDNIAKCLNVTPCNGKDEMESTCEDNNDGGQVCRDGDVHGNDWCVGKTYHYVQSSSATPSFKTSSSLKPLSTSSVLSIQTTKKKRRRQSNKKAKK
jgi:hypothetical protein